MSMKKLIESMDRINKSTLTEGETTDTKTGRIHKGSYGTSHEAGDDVKKAETVRGRGRPKKDADDSGEVKSYDFSQLGAKKGVKLPAWDKDKTTKHSLKEWVKTVEEGSKVKTAKGYSDVVQGTDVKTVAKGVAEGYNDLGREYGGAYVNGQSDDARMTARLTRQAKAAAAKAGKTFGTSAEYRLWHKRQKEKQGVSEGFGFVEYSDGEKDRYLNGERMDFQEWKRARAVGQDRGGLAESHLDEISDKMLNRYNQAAHTEIQGAKFGRGKGTPEGEKTIAKREKGKASASKRLNARRDEKRATAWRPEIAKTASGPQDWYGQNRYIGDSIEQGTGMTEGSMSPKQKKFAKLADPKDKITYADKIAGAKKDKNDVSEGETTNTKTGRIHKGSYGTSHEAGDDVKKAETVRGRGRPKKDADDSGEVKSYDFSQLGAKKGVKLPAWDKDKTTKHSLKEMDNVTVSPSKPQPGQMDIMKNGKVIATADRTKASQMADAIKKGTVKVADTTGQQGVSESRNIQESSDALEHIMNKFKFEVKEFINDQDLDHDLYEALFDYYQDQGEIPYGVAKGRTGDPFEWISQKFFEELSDRGMIEDDIMSNNMDSDISHSDLLAQRHGKMQERALQFESWNNQLSSLLDEGMTVSSSTGNDQSPDTVSITATDEDASQLISIVRNAGLGVFGGDDEELGSPAGGFSVSALDQTGDTDYEDENSEGTPDDITVIDDGDAMLDLIKKIAGVSDAGPETSTADDSEDEEGSLASVYTTDYDEDGEDDFEDETPTGEESDEETDEESDEEKVDEGVANSADDTSEQDLQYILKLISGGMNGEKRDQSVGNITKIVK